MAMRPSPSGSDRRALLVILRADIQLRGVEERIFSAQSAVNSMNSRLKEGKLK
jgi:hypothetical protein